MFKMLGLLFAAFLAGCSAQASHPKEIVLKSNGATVTVALDPLISFKDGDEELIAAMAVASHPKAGTQMLRYNVLVSTCVSGEKILFITLPTGHEILAESDGTNAPDSPAAMLHDAICNASKHARKISVSGPGSPARGKDV
jgi:hypothetical protein